MGWLTCMMKVLASILGSKVMFGKTSAQDGHLLMLGLKQRMPAYADTRHVQRGTPMGHQNVVLHAYLGHPFLLAAR